ncbi:MAG: metal ABC transporter permease [Dehalococcoidia bacterium]|nr:metal ABC transporter permease [Dehalococcoidia bacterium]
MSFLTAPLQYEFFRNALLAAVLIGSLTGFMATFVVLRKMSYVGHGLSHAILGGGVLGYVLGLNFYLIAGIWGFLAALAIDAVARTRRVGADAAIGVVTTAAFAFGVLLISRGHSFARNFEAALFGNVLGVTTGDILMIAVVSVVVVTVTFLAYWQFLFVTFDAEVASVYGVKTGVFNTLFSLMLAGSILVSAQVVGVTLIAAALVTPAVVARFMTSSFRVMLAISTLAGALSGLLGVFASYYVDAASGATIVLVGSSLFVLALGYRYARERRSGQRAAPSPTELDAAFKTE